MNREENTFFCFECAVSRLESLFNDNVEKQPYLFRSKVAFYIHVALVHDEILPGTPPALKKVLKQINNRAGTAMCRCGACEITHRMVRYH